MEWDGNLIPWVSALRSPNSKETELGNLLLDQLTQLDIELVCESTELALKDFKSGIRSSDLELVMRE